MSSPAVSFFDRLADRYDETWTNQRAGRLQRDAVWREVDPLVRPPMRILDLGCGTGEDALHFQERGAVIDALDGSPGMIEAARRRGVDARLFRIEQIGELAGPYDLVFSNFGALNCVESLEALREPLATLTRPGGSLAICMLNRFCLWETAHYGLRGEFRRAARRWSGKTVASSGLRVFYPRARALARILDGPFRLARDTGIGIAVPPSCVSGIRPEILDRLAKIDARIGAWRALRALGDHRLLIFSRLR